jgi:23S rRNA (uridine2552-2'-O)-methyltransferase
VFARGQSVLDLGAAPGSWSMFASERVGPAGRVLAIDLSEIRGALDGELVGQAAPFDVVLSDMAPSTTGSKAADQYRSFELCMKAIEIARAFGAPGGAFVGKIFMSEDFVTARDALRAVYSVIKTIKPEGTRKSSTEVFLVGLDKKPSV